tara:strand:- start:2871 stop:3650 length:780 start_codon:yes stop_codon:yes gene_type:complete
MSQLAGKTALITGGGTGIGEAIAIDLAGAGVRTIICGRRADPLEDTVKKIESDGGKASYLLADMADPESIEILARDILAQGGVDILVNNAGFSSKVRSVRYISAEEWRAVMDVNTMGPAMLTRMLLDSMIERGAADVVLISSLSAYYPSIMAGAAYSAAKVAARSYMSVLSAEVKQFGIRCLTVFPGEVDTPILDKRALVPGKAERTTMLQSEDVSAAVMSALNLPQRANIFEIAIAPTEARDLSKDMKAAMTKKTVED